MTRQNLLLNPSFRSTLNGVVVSVQNWSGITTGTHTATTTPNTVYAFYGDSSLQVTKSNDNGSGVQSDIVSSIAPNTSYAVSAYVDVPPAIPASEDANLAIQITWYDVNGQVISRSTTSTVAATSGAGWQRVTGVFVSPLATTSARFSVVQPIGGTAGQTFLVDGAAVHLCWRLH